MDTAPGGDLVGLVVVTLLNLVWLSIGLGGGCVNVGGRWVGAKPEAPVESWKLFEPKTLERFSALLTRWGDSFMVGGFLLIPLGSKKLAQEFS